MKEIKMSSKKEKIELLKLKQLEHKALDTSLSELHQKNFEQEEEITNILGELILEEVLATNKVWSASGNASWISLHCETDYSNWQDLVPANSIGSYLRYGISNDSDGFNRASMLYEDGEVKFNFPNFKSASEFVIKNHIKISDADFIDRRNSLKEELDSLNKMIKALGIEESSSNGQS